MKYLFLLLAFVSASVCLAQPYYRLNGETKEAFVTRICRTRNFAHPILETNEWDSTHKSIIYFLPAKTSEGDAVIGYLLVPLSMMSYRKVLIDTIFQEGGDPKIESVLFANADKDSKRELIVMTSWPQSHPGAGIEGTLYGTYIFDDPGTDIHEYQLKFFKDLSEKLDGGFEGVRDRETVKANYKNAAQIRAGLRKMGY